VTARPASFDRGDALQLDFDVPFDEAIAWARARKAMLPAEFYGPRLQAVRARGFAIAGLAALDQAQAAADSLAEATAGGATFAEWQRTVRDAAPDVFSLGRARRELIFRNAVQTHYGIGRTIQQREDAAARPFLMWDAINDSRTRPTHAAMDGHIAPIGAPIWKKWHSPPCGHNCRCSRIALTEAQARARGYPKDDPGVEPDAGWEGDPLDGNEDLISVIRARRDACGLTFAPNKRARGVHCDEGPARDRMAQSETVLQRDGAFPELKPAGALRELQAATYSQEQLYTLFQSAVQERIEQARWMAETGHSVGPDRSLFLKQGGGWKIGKGDRARWLLFLADTLIDPAEVREVEAAPNAAREILLLGGYSMPRREIYAAIVFRQVRSQWVGVSAYDVFARTLSKYRAGSSLIWFRK
jgi:SPP1 gp7 family putative phage head morphogenesis protein